MGPPDLFALASGEPGIDFPRMSVSFVHLLKMKMYSVVSVDSDSFNVDLKAELIDFGVLSQVLISEE